MSHRLAFALACGMYAALGCGDTAGPVIPATVALELGVARLEPGETTRATVTVTDAEGRPITGLSVSYSSSNANVARVDATGLVTGVSEGLVTISATASGKSATEPLTVAYTVAAVTLNLPSSTLDVDDTTRAAAVAVSPRGAAVPGRSVSYSTSDAAIASVSTAGLVQAVAPGAATITATIESVSGSAAVTVQVRAASLVISPDGPRIEISSTAQLNAVARDIDGNVLPGRTFTWTSADAQRVTVSSTGLATWRAPGRTTVIARTGSASSSVTISTAGDFAVVGVHFTQGVQDESGTMPLVADGGPAAVLVVLSTQVRVIADMRVALRLLNAGGTLVHSDTEWVSAAIDAVPTVAQPAVRFLLPAAHIQSGLQWQVVRDPAGETPDDDATTDVYPRSGPAVLVVADVPPLNVRFVPITLSANGGSTPAISQADLDGYLRTVRSSLPVGRVNATIAPAFATSASFGTAPSGGASGFWLQALQELDLARTADPSDPTAHWYGVVSPPAGFNFTQFGGFAYIPSNPQSTGQYTRTALGVRTGWFFNVTQARDLVAHELAHNFGRYHSPCGGPTGLDTAYPNPDGRLGTAMHDVYSWSTNPNADLQTIPASTGDMMGYCFPLWSSTYTYSAILNARGAAIAVAASDGSGARTSVLAIQGVVRRDGTAPMLLPPVALHARPSYPEGKGDYRLQGFDDLGRLLFDHAFDPVPVDHDPDAALFTFALPMDATIQRLHTLRLKGPTGSAALESSAAPSTPTVRPGTDGRLSVSCGDALARVAVQDEDTGRLLGVSTGTLAIATTALRLGVSCGRGAWPVRRIISAP